jgi:hypothetical protein
MENKILEQLAREIAKSENRQHILDEIEWFLNGHYTKCRFIAILMGNIQYKHEYYKLAEELYNKELLLKLYKMIKEFMHNKS